MCDNCKSGFTDPKKILDTLRQKRASVAGTSFGGAMLAFHLDEQIKYYAKLVEGKVNG